MADPDRESFGSRLGVILAMAGSAIGLGNLWRFPYIMGQNGGAVFVLIYIAAMFLISLPVFMAEVMIGRKSQINASSAMGKLAPGKPFWKNVGLLAVIIPMLITSYYSVIGGWSTSFLLRSCFTPFSMMDPGEASQCFGGLVSTALEPVVMHLVFLGLCCAVVIGGVESGIEKFSKVAIPVLFVMIVIIMVYSMSLPGAKGGIDYILKPDFSKITPRAFALALGQSFFSLSLGMGIIVTYGSYVKKNENILASSTGTAISDLAFALLAALAIMPAVFAAGIEPGAGPGLIFQSIPYVFSKMGAEMPVMSAIMSVLFFLSVVIAAMTSCVSLIEVGVAWLIERFGMKRNNAAKLVFCICATMGVFCSLSFGPLSKITVGGQNIFGCFDYVCSNILLLIMAFLSVVFVGFVMKKEDVKDEFTNNGALKLNNRVFGVVYFLIKWVAPAAVLVIFVTNFIL